MFVPVTAVAQEFSPSPEPTPVVEESPTPETVATETSQLTETPTPEPTNSAQPTEIPSETVEPTTQSTESAVTENSQTTTETSTPTSTPVITTDKDDYHPGETATITGHFFESLQNLVLKVFGGTVEEGNYKEDSYNVTTDVLGSFIFQYVLDNVFRPLYSVEVSDSQDTKLAETTFTDSPLCQNDVEGANDLPGQKDLTRMCADYAALPTTLSIDWNWDDSAWSGGNTGDGCALFDTDDDGDVNYALCITVGGNPAAFISKQLYSCNDTKSDRCAGKVAISSSASTTCTASIQSTDPFPLGSSFPSDTTGSCTILMSDISSTTVDLVDVCSYPSNEPNSDPSDCIVATQQHTAKLEIVKDLIPSSDPGLFNLQIDGSTLVSNVSDNGTTGEIVVLASGGSGTAHTFSETAGIGTSLSNYTTTVQCRDNNGSGSVISTTGSNPWTINIVKDKDIVCTITNTRINNASLTIVKDAVPNDAQDFSFTTTGTGLSNFTLDDDSDNTLSNTKVFSNLASGIYSVSETAVAGWDQTSATCTDGSTLNSINLSPGENVTCTITNSRLPKLTVVKQVINDNGGTKQISDFPLFVNGSSVTSGTTNIYSTGSYVVSETTDNGYTATFLGDCDAQGNVSLSYGDDKTCTITNNDKPGHLIVYKVTVPNNTQEVFTITPTGLSSDTVATGSPRDFTVNAGIYSVIETAKTGWEETGNTCSNITVANGETKECTITNTQKGKIIVKKETLPDGDSQSFEFVANYSSNFNLSDGQQNDSDYLSPSIYSVSENVPSGWDLTSATCDDGSSINRIELGAGEIVTCTFNNTKRGSIFGYKYEDLNGNGTNDNDWIPVLGWTIELWQGQTKLEQTSTDASGYYSFTNLIQGVYSVVEQMLSGWDNATADSLNISLTAGENDGPNNFVNFEKATIVVHKDVVNPDGGQTVDNTSFKVKLNGSDEKTISEDTTATYSDLVPGSYTITESFVPSGYELVSLTDGGIVNIQSGETHHVYVVNKQNPAKLTVIKNVINNNGGALGADDFTMTVAGNNPSDTSFAGSETGVTIDLYAGNYSVDEIEISGYTKSLSTDCSGTINWGEEKTCTITNTRDMGEIIIKKVIDEDGDLNTINDQILASGWEINVDGLSGDVDDPASGSTDSNGEYKTGKIKTGVYSASETSQSGFDFVSAVCSDQSPINNITLGKDETITCIFYNTPNGTIHGYKWNDLNGDGVSDLGENRLGGWTINLYGWDEEDKDYTNLVKSTVTDSNPGIDFGWYWFTHIYPGDYKVCEVNQNGWQQTYPTNNNGCHLVSIPDTNPNNFELLENFVEVSPVYNFGNMEDDPEVEIEKSNSALTSVNINSEVTYTLLVKNTGNVNLTDLKVYDAIPGGFEYVLGSSYLNGFLHSDPNVFGGLLSWNIGNLGKGENAEIVYKLKVGDSVLGGGSYDNFATCEAYYTTIASNELLRVELDQFTRNKIECNIASSKVLISTSNSYGGSLTGQVLGASTELPATGNPSWALAFALLGLAGGLILKKKYV